MAKLMMVAGKQVRGSDGQERVGAYVVLSAGRMSRIFSVRGTTASAQVTELPAATTIDLKRFESELERELEAESGSAAGASSRPSDVWACRVVQKHLKDAENLEVE